MHGTKDSLDNLINLVSFYDEIEKIMSQYIILCILYIYILYI